MEIGQSSESIFSQPQSNLREYTVERRAIIESISYEGMNQSRSGRGGKGARDNPELAQVIIAGSSQCSCVLSKRQLTKMTPRSQTEVENRKVGNSAKGDSESSLSSCWRVPNQIY